MKILFQENQQIFKIITLKTSKLQIYLNNYVKKSLKIFCQSKNRLYLCSETNTRFHMMNRNQVFQVA